MWVLTVSTNVSNQNEYFFKKSTQTCHKECHKNAILLLIAPGHCGQCIRVWSFLAWYFVCHFQKSCYLLYLSGSIYYATDLLFTKFYAMEQRTCPSANLWAYWMTVSNMVFCSTYQNISMKVYSKNSILINLRTNHILQRTYMYM